MTDDELREIRERWEPKAGIYQGYQWPADTLVVTASMTNALIDVPRLLAEVERLRGALVAVDQADCCGCAIYSEIACAALAGRPIVLEKSGGMTYLKD